MSIPIETIRVTDKGRNSLIRLKQTTKIQNWNTLCRWAFCLSIKDKRRPAPLSSKEWSNIEMTWKVFGGKNSDIYLALLIQRCIKDQVEVTDSNLYEQFHMHLHRGIMKLSDRSIQGIEDLITKVPQVKEAMIG